LWDLNNMLFFGSSSSADLTSSAPFVSPSSELSTIEKP
jgi:hypothetical protein